MSSPVARNLALNGTIERTPRPQVAPPLRTIFLFAREGNNLQK